MLALGSCLYINSNYRKEHYYGFIFYGKLILINNILNIYRKMEDQAPKDIKIRNSSSEEETKADSRGSNDNNRDGTETALAENGGMTFKSTNLTFLN